MSNEQLTVDNEQLPEGYKQTEVGVIPEDWEICPVGQMGEVVTGKALAANGPGQQRPYLRTKNVFDGRIDIDDVLTMPMTEAQFMHFRIVRGDVLLNEGQSLELVGRCAMYQDEYPEPCAMQNQLLRFRARASVSAAFACHLFRYCQQTGVFARIALQTTSVAHLGSKRFERLLLPCPKSEAEQRSIATALSDVDALIVSLDKLIDKKRAIKTATMQQLLTGKKRLPEFGKGKGYKKTEVGVVPEDWEVIKIEELGTVIRGASPRPKGDKRYYGGKIPRLMVEDVTRDGKFVTPSVDFLTEEGAKRSRPCPQGTLTLVCSGTVGIPSFLAIDACIHDGFLALIDIKKNINGDFLYHFLKTQQSRFDNSATHGGVFTNLTTEIFRNFRVPVPQKVEEQRSIATVLSDMDAEIAALEARRAKTQAIKHGMMQELLTGRIRLIDNR